MRVNLSKYKAVIFDWDGTLVDTCGILLQAHNHLREVFGLKLWSMEEYMKLPSLSAKEFFSMMYEGRAEEADTIFYDFIKKHHLTYLKPMDCALSVLDSINLPMGIVSNKRHDALHVEVDAMKWRSYFKSIIGAGHADKDKPAPAPLLMSMAEIDEDLVPSDVLYIGDTETDLMTAQNTGCPSVLIQSDKPRPDLIKKYNPDFAFDDLKSFIDAITVHAPVSDKCAV